MSKKYSLQPVETQLLQSIVQQQANAISNAISFVAIQRLGLTVTEATHFQFNDDMTEITVDQGTPDVIGEK